MRTRTILLALAFCLASYLTCFAADANVGTWKLNEAKSKIPAGAAKNTTVVYTAEGDKYKCIVDGVDSSGKPTHNEWTGKMDGKPYPVTGDQNSDMRTIQKVDADHYKITGQKGGKTTLTGNVAFSNGGKTRTLTLQGTDADGKKTSATYVYDKQ
jgi:hypothetical protein